MAELPLTDFGLVGVALITLSSIATLAVKSLVDKRKNGNDGSGSKVCPVHDQCMQVVSQKSDALSVSQALERDNKRIQILEESLLGQKGIVATVARLEERSYLAAALREGLSEVASALRGWSKLPSGEKRK